METETSTRRVGRRRRKEHMTAVGVIVGVALGLLVTLLGFGRSRGRLAVLVVTDAALLVVALPFLSDRQLDALAIGLAVGGLAGAVTRELRSRRSGTGASYR